MRSGGGYRGPVRAEARGHALGRVDRAKAAGGWAKRVGGRVSPQRRRYRGRALAGRLSSPARTRPGCAGAVELLLAPPSAPSTKPPDAIASRARPSVSCRTPARGPAGARRAPVEVTAEARGAPPVGASIRDRSVNTRDPPPFSSVGPLPKSVVEATSRPRDRQETRPADDSQRGRPAGARESPARGDRVRCGGRANRRPAGAGCHRGRLVVGRELLGQERERPEQEQAHHDQ